MDSCRGRAAPGIRPRRPRPEADRHVSRRRAPAARRGRIGCHRPSRPGALPGAPFRPPGTAPRGRARTPSSGCPVARRRGRRARSRARSPARRACRARRARPAGPRSCASRTRPRRRRTTSTPQPRSTRVRIGPTTPMTSRIGRTAMMVPQSGMMTLLRNCRNCVQRPVMARNHSRMCRRAGRMARAERQGASPPVPVGRGWSRWVAGSERGRGRGGLPWPADTRGRGGTG